MTAIPAVCPRAAQPRYFSSGCYPRHLTTGLPKIGTFFFNFPQKFLREVILAYVLCNPRKFHLDLFGQIVVYELQKNDICLPFAIPYRSLRL